MDESIKWALGAIITLVTMIGGIMTRDRQILDKIEAGDKENRAKCDKAMEEQAQIRREYVRRDELKDHILSMERILAQSREDQKDLTRRMDTFMATMSSKHNRD